MKSSNAVAIALSISSALLLGGCSSDEIAVPKVAGKTCQEASQILEDAGFTDIEIGSWSEADGAEFIEDTSDLNCVITSQKPVPGSDEAPDRPMILTADTSGNATSPDSETSAAPVLDDTSAEFACGSAWEDRLSAEYPGSDITAHTIMGIIAHEENPDGSHYIKLEVSIDERELNAECNVSGTSDNPEVELLSAY